MVDNWFRKRNLTLELIVGHWAGAMNFRKSHLNTEKLNPILAQKNWWSGFPSPVHILKCQNYHSPVTLILILNVNPSWFNLFSSISSFPCLLGGRKTFFSYWQLWKSYRISKLRISLRPNLPRQLASLSRSLFCFVFVENLYPDEKL